MTATQALTDDLKKQVAETPELSSNRPFAPW